MTKITKTIEIQIPDEAMEETIRFIASVAFAAGKAIKISPLDGKGAAPRAATSLTPEQTPRKPDSKRQSAKKRQRVSEDKAAPAGAAPTSREVTQR
ncbi:MAG: hypothetical protein WDM84_07175 [Bauldia sp.]